MRKRYLQEDRPVLHSNLILSCKLYQHLAEIDRACVDRMDLLTRQMADREGVTEALKAVDQFEWVRCMNSIHMSRVGCDYLQTGFYTEVLFRQHGVHFIAIANNVDSEDTSTNEFAPFLNIMNEWYLRDVSRKVKAAYQTKGKAGLPTNCNAIFGYLKDPENKNHWIIDEEAAPTVRRIFQLAVEGNGPYTIAKILTAEKVEAPGPYWARKGLWTLPGDSTPYEWYGHTVSDILSKPEYMGHTVNFRTSKESYTDFSVLTTPMINAFVDRIEVHAPSKPRGKREQQIDLYLNFIGNFPIPVEAIQPVELTSEEQELAEKRAGYRQKYQRRKELAAQRAAETQNETI